MDDAPRSEFVVKHTRLLAKAWPGEAFANQFRPDPTRALSEFSLSAPADPTLEIVARVDVGG